MARDENRPAVHSVASEHGKSFAGHQRIALGDFRVGGDHFLHQIGKADLRFPAEPGARLAGIAEQGFDFRRTEVAWIDPDHRSAVDRIDADLVGSGAAPLDSHAELLAGARDELAHRVLLAGCDDEVVAASCCSISHCART